MSRLFIYSETTHLALELVTGARVLGGQLHVVTINNEDQAAMFAQKGLDTYSISNSAVILSDTAVVAEVLKQTAEKLQVDTILLASNRRGKELSGRLAQAWEAGCLTDVKELVTAGGNIGCKRNTLGGATIATQFINTPRKVIAILPKSFERFEGFGIGQVHPMEITMPAPTVTFLGKENKKGDAVDIQAAPRLVVVGMGVENQEDLPRIMKIAKAFGAEVACSKPIATDKKWLSEERIVGLSGKLCKPELAIIFGVSGQVQFVVGIREAKVIISINNDDNAYMNSIADYFLVADAKPVIEELENALR